MSYGGHDPYRQRSYPPQYNPPVQHSGFVNPQQLTNPTSGNYGPSQQSYYLANGHGNVRNPQTPEYNAGPAQYVPAQSQHMSAVVIPAFQQQQQQQQFQPRGFESASYVSYQSPQQYNSPVPHGSPQPYTAATQSHHESQVQQKPTPLTPDFSVEYQLLLVSMAEEYFTAAHSRGSMANILSLDDDCEEYYKLLSLGLSCLEGLLRRYKLSPEMEVKVRLRYATVLHEETDNTMEAEEALSKGILICERHRYEDMKYNMQHLLIRLMFQKNPRASFKFLERCVADAMAYQHIAWIYAFRFLKVTLHLQLSSRQDLHSASGQLRIIADLAGAQGDKSVSATARTFDALVALRDCSDNEAFEQAQRALASVRSLQLDPIIGENAQLKALTSIADLSCHLMRYNPGQASSAMKTMLTHLDKVCKQEIWGAESIFAIPLGSAKLPRSNLENGLIQAQKDGSKVLLMNWMSKDDAYNLGYLLAGVTMAPRNNVEGLKSERTLKDGIQGLEASQATSSKVPQSIMHSVKLQTRREQMIYNTRLQLAFNMVARTAWSEAQSEVLNLKVIQSSWEEVPDSMYLIGEYLQASIDQGTGELSKALGRYDAIIESAKSVEGQTAQSPGQKRHPSPLERDLYILSTLNKLLIIRNPSSSLHSQCSTLVSSISSLCTSNPNRNIACAYHLLSSILPSSNPSTILSTKSSLQSALQIARALANTQLTCIILNIMSWKFFSGVVADQSEKSAKASLSLAKKGGDSLWTCVASGSLARTLEAAGKVDEANVVWSQGTEKSKELPVKVREFVER